MNLEVGVNIVLFISESHLSTCVYVRGRRVIWISGSLIRSKTLMVQIPVVNFGEVGPFSQIHSPHLLAGAPGIFSDLLRSVQMLKRELVRKATGNYRTYPSLVKLQLGFLSFTVENLPLSRTVVLVPDFAVKDLPLSRLL